MPERRSYRWLWTEQCHAYDQNCPCQIIITSLAHVVIIQLTKLVKMHQVYTNESCTDVSAVKPIIMHFLVHKSMSSQNLTALFINIPNLISLKCPSCYIRTNITSYKFVANAGMKAFQAEAPDSTMKIIKLKCSIQYTILLLWPFTKTFKLSILQGFTVYCIYDLTCSITRFTNTIPRVSQYGANQATYVVLEVCQSE